MKRLIYLLMPVLMAMVPVSCGREPLPQGQDGKDPVLETMEATGVSQTKATLNAKLEMDGVQYAELVCGFKLGTSDRRLDQFLSCEKTGDAYSTSLSALTDNTKYWYQAYAKVDGKEYSGAIISFTTEKLPKGAVNLGFVMTREDGTEYTLFWAESNLCESGLCAKPEDYGDYYAWAETEPYYTEGHSQDRPCTSWRPGRSTYYWPSYKWCNGAYDKLTKYCHTTKKNYWDGEGNPDGMLSLKDNDYKDDVARVKLGGKWRIPTYAEWKELMNRCVWTWTTRNRVNGRVVAVPPGGNSIFLPAAGRWQTTGITDAGEFGYYYASTLTTSPEYADDIKVGPEEVFGSFGARCFGKSIRPVWEE